MTVQDFVNKYQKAKDAEKAKILKEIEIKTYIPFAEKVVHSEAVLSQSVKRVNNVLQLQSARRFLVFVTSIVKLYTNLEVNKEKPHEDYDLLRESGLIDLIREKIGDDLEEFTTVFNMTWDDMVYNENNWRMFVASQLNSFIDNVEQRMADENFWKQINQLNILKTK